MIKIGKKTFIDYFKRAWRELAVLAAVLIVDLVSKYAVSKTMVEDAPGKEIIPNFFHITYVKNDRVAFSFDFWLTERMGEEGIRIFLICLISVVSLGFIAYMVYSHRQRFLYRLPLAMIVGGALGNLYDRIFHHAVRDFLHIEYFGHTINGYGSFPIFNLADSALVLGGILFMIVAVYSFIKEEKDKRKKVATSKSAEGTASESTAINDSGENVTGSNSGENVNVSGSGEADK